jgi:hypothetical protein
MSFEEVYKNWRSTLNKPDDSLFFYHPNLERVLLGLSIFVLTPQPALNKLGKAKPLKILHYQVPDLITAWIDNNEEVFEKTFSMVMKVAESYLMGTSAYGRKFPSKHKTVMEIGAFYAHATSCGGDLTPALAEELLNDLSTDGEKIYSDKIANFGSKLLALTHKYGIDIPLSMINDLNVGN